jgi:predicted MFS family arabinose efflux permease
MGVGVSLALMAGLKGIVTWFPAERLAIANGMLVMLGALGAVTATAPAEIVVAAIGWRGLFAALALLAAATALVIRLAVPEAPPKPQATERVATLWDVYRDRRFWRIAPLSSLGVGTAWSLQGLWAAPWLRDVAGLERGAIVQHLGIMALSVAASALLLGMAADRLRRRGIGTEALLGATVLLSMAAQAALLLEWPLPSQLLWATVAAAGAATVLSFAILAALVPKDMSGRANAALNLLHIGCAFLLQTATGVIIARWDKVGAGYPPEAHRTAMAVILLLQGVAFAWFAAPRRSDSQSARAPREGARAAAALSGFTSALAPAIRSATARRRGPTASALSWELAHPRYRRQRSRHGVLSSDRGWRLAAAASLALSVALAAALTAAVSRPAIAVHIVIQESGDQSRGAEAQRPPASLPASRGDHLETERLPAAWPAAELGVSGSAQGGER